jgi:drug/metabolite transporter (DMT)-like permease
VAASRLPPPHGGGTFRLAHPRSAGTSSEGTPPYDADPSEALLSSSDPPLPTSASDPARSPASGGVSALTLLAAAVGFGATYPAVKATLGDRPLFGAGWLYLSSGIGLFALRFVLPRSSEPPLTRADLPWLAGAIACGGVVAPIAQVHGLSLLPAHTGALLSNLEIVFTALLALAFFGERLSLARWAGVVALLSGGVLAAGGLARPSLAGFLWFTLAYLAWGLDNNLTRRIAHRDPAQITRWKGFVGGSVTIAAALVLFGWPAGMGLREWVGGAAIGFVGYGLSLIGFIRGLRRFGAARAAAVFIVVSTFVGVLAAALFLKEPLSPYIAVAGLLIVVGTPLVTRADRVG